MVASLCAITWQMLFSTPGHCQPYDLSDPYQYVAWCAEAADWIYLCTVSDTLTAWEGEFIWTRYRADVVQTMKGTGTPPVEFWSKGGVRGGSRTLSHFPRFALDRMYIVFLGPCWDRSESCSSPYCALLNDGGDFINCNGMRVGGAVDDSIRTWVAGYEPSALRARSDAVVVARVAEVKSREEAHVPSWRERDVLNLLPTEVLYDPAGRLAVPLPALSVRIPPPTDSTDRRVRLVPAVDIDTEVVCFLEASGPDWWLLPTSYAVWRRKGDLVRPAAARGRAPGAFQTDPYEWETVLSLLRGSAEKGKMR